MATAARGYHRKRRSRLLHPARDELRGDEDSVCDTVGQGLRHLCTSDRTMETAKGEGGDGVVVGFTHVVPSATAQSGHRPVVDRHDHAYRSMLGGGGGGPAGSSGAVTSVRTRRGSSGTDAVGLLERNGARTAHVPSREMEHHGQVVRSRGAVGSTRQAAVATRRDIFRRLKTRQIGRRRCGTAVGVLRISRGRLFTGQTATAKYLWMLRHAMAAEDGVAPRRPVGTRHAGNEDQQQLSRSGLRL